MRNARLLRYSLIVLAVIVSLLPASASACASCFGQSDSPMAQGMNAGIFALLLVITSVLLVIAIFFAYILRRAARLNAVATVVRDAEPPARKTHRRVIRPTADLISTPLQRGVSASDEVRTVSTVSTAREKPLKRFLLSSRPDTPLKRGANERERPQRQASEISGQASLASAASPVSQPTH